MGKKLAIRGHATRGKEVIELLEMMGGYADELVGNGTDERYAYFILEEENNAIDGFPIDKKDEFEFDSQIFTLIFTLEEFLKKYPFKVGDKVVYTKFGDNCDDYPLIIKSMKWTGITIEYAFDGYVTCLAKDLKMWNGEPDAVISGIYLNSCDYADEVELNLGDYEIVVRDGKTYAVIKKPKYPTTYDECCKVLDYCCDYFLTTYDNNGNPSAISNILNSVNTLIKLLICRNAYWKIAGEEMELDKPWKPEYDCNDTKYIISTFRNTIYKDISVIFNYILIFPTEEMRDVFHENFKDLIEQCKELL